MDIKELFQAIYDGYQYCIETDDPVIRKLAQANEYLDVFQNNICLIQHHAIGTMDIKKDFGFLRQPEDDIYIDKKHLNGAMQDDLVIVDDTGYQAKVVAIIQRALTLIICRCHKQGEMVYFQPITNIQQLLKITYDQPLVDGHLVSIKIDSIDELSIHGHVKEIIGHEHDPDIETKKIVSSYHRNNI